MSTSSMAVIGGVDTHAETHHAALITITGQHLIDREFPTSPAGYAELAQFLTSHGPLQQVGVEGTSSYGAGLLPVLQAAGLEVVEVIRPNRGSRRRGKSDPIDAYQAAKETLAGQFLPIPKAPGGAIDAIRPLLITRHSAVAARAAVLQLISSLLITAPQGVRERFRRLPRTQRINALARLRPQPATTDPTAAMLFSLKRLAQRYQTLTVEITDSEADLEQWVTRTNPALHATHGIGTITAAQLLITAGDNPHRIRNQAAFAALTGTSPIPASSGHTNKWRLNRGGDRQANCALHQIIIVRLASDAATKAYYTRRKAEGKTRRDIIRCLKRALAKEVFQLLLTPHPTTDNTDLRNLRHQRGITLQQAANHLDTWPTSISRLERGQRNDHRLAKQYRDWLTQQPAA